jgi:hypothetical protein
VFSMLCIVSCSWINWWIWIIKFDYWPCLFEWILLLALAIKVLLIFGTSKKIEFISTLESWLKLKLDTNLDRASSLDLLIQWPRRLPTSLGPTGPSAPLRSIDRRGLGLRQHDRTTCSTPQGTSSTDPQNMEAWAPLPSWKPQERQPPFP